MELNYSEEDTKMHAEIEWHQQLTDCWIDQLEDWLFKAFQSVEENLKNNAQWLFKLSHQKGKQSKQPHPDISLLDSSPPTTQLLQDIACNEVEEGPRDIDMDLSDWLVPCLFRSTFYF